jgi:hypothetical protein
MTCSQYNTTQASNLVCLDLRDAMTGIPYFITRLQRKLGTNQFPIFERAVREFMTRGVDIENTEITGQENIFQVIINDPEELQRDMRFNRLKKSFFDDIANFQQTTVLLLDTFNEASSDLQDWISSEFLGEIAEPKNLNFVVVVAGQKTPLPSIEWSRCYQHCRLGAIQTEAWYQYVRETDQQLSQDHIDMVTALFKVPAEVVNAFQVWRSKQN